MQPTRTKLLLASIAAALLSSAPLGLANHEHPLIPPADSPWSFSADVAGRTETFRLPADLPKIKALPKADRDNLLAGIGRVENNQRHVRKVFQNFFAPNPATTQRDLRLTPEYDRTLAEVAISISYADVGNPKPLWRHEPILRALPAYTRLHIVMPPPTLAGVKKMLAEMGLADRAMLHPLEDWNRKKENVTRYSRQTRWVRDTFMVGTDGSGKAAIFVPLAYAKFSDLTKSDLDFVRRKWHDPQQITSLPVFLRGGNVAVAERHDGRRLAFVGDHEIALNEEHFVHSTGMAPPKPLIPEVLKRIAQTTDVRVLPNTDRLFHIDMAVNFLAPGLAAVVAPLDEGKMANEDLQVLATLRRKLAENGFRVINVPTTAARIKAYRSPVNALPFVDKTTGKRKLIVPRFEDETVTVDGRPQSLNEAIRTSYERAGIEVVFAEDRFSDRWGNVHCAILALN